MVKFNHNISLVIFDYLILLYFGITKILSDLYYLINLLKIQINTNFSKFGKLNGIYTYY